MLGKKIHHAILRLAPFGAGWAGVCLLVSVLLEQALGWLPCTLCRLQQGLVGVALVLFILIRCPLINAVHRLLTGLTVCVLLAGVSLAAWHVWLQQRPALPGEQCLPGLVYLWSQQSFTVFLQSMLQSAASCHHVQGQALGLSLPVWVLLSYGFLFALIWLFYAISGLKPPPNLS